MKIPERVEELKLKLHSLGYASDKEEISTLSEEIEEMFESALTETDQQAREEGYEKGLKEGQNATALEVIKGYNAEKLQLIEALKRTGNEEFYIQGDISRRLKEVDANLVVLTNPPSQV